ncbi:hypothetical protein [Sphingobium yanoikuyae]
MSNNNRYSNTVTTSQGSIISLNITSEQDAINVIDAFRTSCANQFSVDREEMKQLRLATRGHLYVLLAAYCGISFKLLEPENHQFLVAVLGQHGLAPARAGSNPYRPLADMLFGEWVNEEFTDAKGKVKKRKKPDTATAVRTVNGKKQFFVPNRSAEKYAKVARRADALNWNADEIAEKLSSVKGGMEAVLKADTAASKATDEDEIEADELVEMVYASTPHSTVELSDVGLSPSDAERKLVGLWAEIKDGEVLIRGVLPTSETALEAFVRKYAKANATKLFRQKIKAMGQAVKWDTDQTPGASASV